MQPESITRPTVSQPYCPQYSVQVFGHLMKASISGIVPEPGVGKGGVLRPRGYPVIQVIDQFAGNGLEKEREQAQSA